MSHWKAKSAVTFREVADGLWMFSAVDPASKRGKTHCCYLMRSGVGNLMLHPPDSPRFYTEQEERIEALGGVQHLAMTHNGDLKYGWGYAWRTWRPRLHGHARDIASAPPGAKPLPLEATGDRLGDLEIVHLPGHTAGYIAFIGEHGGRRRLFSGHLLTEGMLGWRSAVNKHYADVGRRSLARLEELDVEELMPEYAWTGELPGSMPPVAFGPELRSTAVAQAVRALGTRPAV